MTEPMDVEALEDHAQRLFVRMKNTPHGPKRSLLAEQHRAKSSEVKFAEGWNAALAYMKKETSHD